MCDVWFAVSAAFYLNKKKKLKKKNNKKNKYKALETANEARQKANEE